MIFHKTNLKDNYLIEIEKSEDSRGFFARLFCENEFSKRNLNTKWQQINISHNEKTGTLRGLHFQRPPNTEIKLIKCTNGMIWNVIVDLRVNSNSFGNWFGAELSRENRKIMYVPKGFANGYISLKDNSDIIYLVSNSYAPVSEETLLWCDDKISINWPIEPLVISDKDKNGKKFDDVFTFD